MNRRHASFARRALRLVHVSVEKVHSALFATCASGRVLVKSRHTIIAGRCADLSTVLTIATVRALQNKGARFYQEQSGVRINSRFSC